jgi:2-iminobutanoate/2-iminopropanoate deaminase
VPWTDLLSINLIALTSPPQSQAIIANNQIFVSGQIPGTADGKLVEGSIGDKTAACCNNIIAILEAAGSSIERVVKVCPIFVPS